MDFFDFLLKNNNNNKKYIAFEISNIVGITRIKITDPYCILFHISPIIVYYFFILYKKTKKIKSNTLRNSL